MCFILNFCHFSQCNAHSGKQCHASASPSDAQENKFLKAVNVGGRLSARSPSQNISATKEEEKKKKEKPTNQLKDCTKSGLSLLRDRCRITSMRNLTMTLPPPPPPSQTVSPSPTQLLLNIKAHLCHIKAERQEGGGGGGGVGFVSGAVQKILDYFLKQK